jgi:predicted secreted protein
MREGLKMNTKKMFLSIFIIVGAGFVLGGCSVAATDKEPDLIGWVDNVQQLQSEVKGRVLVDSPDNRTSDKFSVTITDKTAIYMQTNDRQQKSEFGSLSAGQKVEIWFSGPVMESYPAQVSADKIVITEDSPPTVMPPLDDGVKSILVEVTCEEFTAQPHITRDIEITYPGSLVVSLCSNRSTGFQWEEVKIGDESVIYLTEYNYVSPEAAGVAGAAGKEVWSFNSNSIATSTLIFEYSRPWEGGEQDEWTFILNVLVK